LGSNILIRVWETVGYQFMTLVILSSIYLQTFLAHTESDVFVSAIQLFENIVQRKRLTERCAQINGGVLLLFVPSMLWDTPRNLSRVLFDQHHSYKPSHKGAQPLHRIRPIISIAANLQN
jgi:hypothetical protein